MTSRNLLSTLIALLLLAPLAALPGRGGTGPAAEIAPADQKVSVGPGTSARLLSDWRGGGDGLAGGADDDLPPAVSSRRTAVAPWLAPRVAPDAVFLRPCGLWPGPRQTTGPPAFS